MPKWIYGQLFTKCYLIELHKTQTEIITNRPLSMRMLLIQANTFMCHSYQR